MAAQSRPLSFTDVELRSYLPSGWGIPPGGSGAWDAERSHWAIDVYDGADNLWTVAVGGAEAVKSGRIAALKAAIERLESKALGRKSVISG